MTINELRVAVQQAEDGYDILRLDKEYEGSCPCFNFTVEGRTVEGHCWRPGCDQHAYVGLHGDIPPDIAYRMAELLTEMDWYGTWVWTPVPHRH